MFWCHLSTRPPTTLHSLTRQLLWYLRNHVAGGESGNRLTSFCWRASSFTVHIKNHAHSSHVVLVPGPWFNINMSSYQYRKFHCGVKTVVRSSYLLNGISYTSKTTSIYWIKDQSILLLYLPMLLQCHWGNNCAYQCRFVNAKIQKNIHVIFNIHSYVIS